MKQLRVCALLAVLLCALPISSFGATIALWAGATWTERAAAGDLQRVIYAATGKLAAIGLYNRSDANVIAVGFAPVGGVDLSAKRLGDQGYVLKTISRPGKTVLIAAGASPVATSYACYSLAERYGAGFYLGGDALPARKTAFGIPKLDIVNKPVFKVRGVLPWYNFFDSPTAWNIEDYRSFIDQLAKSKNNFLGFHSYDYEPFCAYREADGKMVAGAPLVSTAQSTWGTAPMKTFEFAPAARPYFGEPYFGANCSVGYKTPDQGITNAQKLLAQALWYAKARGVKTCVGFEVTGDPTVPGDLDRLERRLKNTLKTYPMLDYVWIWEPEAMGLHGIDPRPPRSDFGAYYRRWEREFAYIGDPRRRSEAVRVGIYALAAYRVIKHEAPNVRMILSAWGGDNHLKFTDFYPGYDKVLPKDVIFSALDNIVVSDTVSAAYGKLSKGREFWPIPWFEYDGDQWCPQPNTQRFYNAARDALSEGASGLLGIHWRTRDVEESHAYISQFAWNPKLGYEEFYRDYARKGFNDERAAKLLMELQDLGYRWIGGHGQTECGGFEWNAAPEGGVERMNAVFRANPSLRPSERLDDLRSMQSWLVHYDKAARILRPDGPLRVLLSELEAQKREPTSEEKARIAKDLQDADSALSTAISFAARRMSNRGELGILATINTKAWASLLNIEKRARDLAIADSASWIGVMYLQPSVRSVLPSDTAFAGQPFKVDAVVFGASSKAKAEVLYRSPGGKFASALLKFVSAGRLEGRIPASKQGLIEYYVRVTDEKSSATWPAGGASAPAYVSVVPPPPTYNPGSGQPTVAVKPGKVARVTLSQGPMLIRLSWPDSGSTRAFEIRRSDKLKHSVFEPDDYTTLATVRDNWYEDRDVEWKGGLSTYYSYRVLDADTGQLIAESSPMKLSEPPLPAPPKLTVTPGPGRVRLSWVADDPTASRYQVYRSDARDPKYVTPGRVLPESDVQGTRTCLWSAQPGHPYFYAIRAFSLSGREGPLSEPVAVTSVEANTAPVLALDCDGSDSIAIPSCVVEQGIPAMRTGTDSFVALPHKEEYNTDGEFTIQFWVKLRNPGIMPVFISHGMWNLDGFFVQHFNSRIRFYLAGVGTVDAGHIDTNRWTAVTCTYDGAEMVVYVDGKKAGSKQAVGLILPANRQFYVGRYEMESKEFEVDGWMGGVRVYPYAVAPEVAESHYQEMTSKLASNEESIGRHKMIVLAHRGESYIAPENTLAAFNLAWEKGAEAVELDCYLTRDNKIVVMHDAKTARTAGTDLVIKDTDSAELRKLDVGKWKGEQYAGEKIPLLAEALATIPPKGMLLIEVKCGPEILPFLRDVIDGSGKRGQVTIISFSLDVVAQSKKMMPDVPHYYLRSPAKDPNTGQFQSYDPKLIQTALDNHIDGLDLHYSMVTKEFADAIKAKGLALWTWTVNDAAEARHQAELGVDGLGTDRCQWLKEQMN